MAAVDSAATNVCIGGLETAVGVKGREFFVQRYCELGGSSECKGNAEGSAGEDIEVFFGGRAKGEEGNMESGRVGFCLGGVGRGRVGTRLRLTKVWTGVRRCRRAVKVRSGVVASLPPAVNAVVGPLFDAVNTSSPDWLRYIVWVDFRFAVMLFVFYPLGLFVGSFTEENDALKRVMVGYWQASSLLMLTVFLNIGEQQIGTFTAMLVQILIPCTVWWWKDLLQEIEDEKTTLSKAFQLWQWPVTIFSSFGGCTQFLFQRCIFVPSLVDDPYCAAWLEPPFNFKTLLLSAVPTSAVTTIGYVSLTIYFTYLAYYITVPLQRAGREGRKERNCFSSVSLLRSWGWLSDPSQPEGGK